MEGEERRGKERRGKERKEKECKASKQASKCQDMYIRCTTYSRYYYLLLGGIVLTTLSINQLIYLSIYLSVCLSVCLLSMHKECLLACWLLLLLLRGRPNYIISYYIMLYSRIYYYLTY